MESYLIKKTIRKSVMPEVDYHKCSPNVKKCYLDKAIRELRPVSNEDYRKASTIWDSEFKRVCFKRKFKRLFALCKAEPLTIFSLAAIISLLFTFALI